jgi:ABC-type branched-subunit amino acid transport system ATPase component
MGRPKVLDADEPSPGLAPLMVNNDLRRADETEIVASPFCCEQNARGRCRRRIMLCVLDLDL